MKAITKIIFIDENGEKFFGEGPYRLLIETEKNGSLHISAKTMCMSYSKAYKLIKNAENALGFPLTERTVGGINGGGSRLTEKGKDWILKYEKYRNACIESDKKLYSKIFSE